MNENTNTNTAAEKVAPFEMNETSGISAAQVRDAETRQNVEYILPLKKGEIATDYAVKIRGWSKLATAFKKGDISLATARKALSPNGDRHIESFRWEPLREGGYTMRNVGGANMAAFSRYAIYAILSNGEKVPFSEMALQHFGALLSPLNLTNARKWRTILNKCIVSGASWGDATGAKKSNTEKDAEIAALREQLAALRANAA